MGGPTAGVMAAAVLLVMLLLQPSSAAFCTRSNATCWPTDADVAALNQLLDPAADRVVYWGGNTSEPKPSPLVYFPGIQDYPQVLGGAGVSGLKAVYVQAATEAQASCFTSESSTTTFCAVAARNNPQGGLSPAFVVFPLTAAHVQAAVLFANKHNLKLCVAGTGHDFLNRHSCDQGMLVRTVLLKNATWELSPTNRFKAAGGYVTFGAGHTWEAVAYSAAANDRLIASGWCGTVGVAGWHLGGGYGPFTRALGLGSDNMLEVELVLADGTLTVANSTGTYMTHPNGTASSSNGTDLFRALRGGGGSTFGVVTALTMRAHKLPAGGVTAVVLKAEADLCTNATAVRNFTAFFLKWAEGLNDKWAGITGMSQSFNATRECNTTVSFQLQYAYYGPSSDPGFSEPLAKIVAAGAVVLPGGLQVFQDQYSLLQLVTVVNPAFVYVEAVPDTFTPTPTFAGSFPSVLVQPATVTGGKLASLLRAVQAECQSGGTCTSVSFSHGLPPSGSKASAGPAASSVNPAMHSALLHVWSTSPGLPTKFMKDLYALGEYSYFGESAYEMEEWPFRYWGLDMYKQLLAVKAAVDPGNTLTCRHCVGDAYNGSDAYGTKYFNDLTLWGASTGGAGTPAPGGTPVLPPPSGPRPSPPRSGSSSMGTKKRHSREALALVLAAPLAAVLALHARLPTGRW